MENQYQRVVPWDGNRAALRAMAQVFELRPYFEWRGLGFISQSALRIKDKFASGMPSSVSRFPACASPIQRRRSAGKF